MGAFAGASNTGASQTGLPARYRLLGGGLAALTVLGLAMPAKAQTLDDDYWLNVQAYYPHIGTNVKVGSTTNEDISTDIDLEKDLGYDRNEVLPEVTGGARFGHVIVGLDYFRLKRSGHHTISRDIVFDDVTYPASADVSSSFSSDVYRLTVGYAFVQKDNLELSAAIGLHATNFDFRIKGTGSVGEETASTEARKKTFLAPVPTVGVSGTYRLAPRLELNGRFDWLSLKVDQYDGRLINTQASVTYKVMDHVGIGLAYRYVDYRVGVDKDAWKGRVRYKFYGPSLLLQASF